MAANADLRLGVLRREQGHRPNVHASESNRGWAWDCATGERVTDGKRSSWPGQVKVTAGDLIGMLLECGAGGTATLSAYKNGARLGCVWDALPPNNEWQWMAELGKDASVRILEPLPPRPPPLPRLLEPPDPP